MLKCSQDVDCCVIAAKSAVCELLILIIMEGFWSQAPHQAPRLYPVWAKWASVSKSDDIVMGNSQTRFIN